MILKRGEVEYDTSSPWWLETDSILMTKSNWEKVLFYTKGKQLVISIDTLYKLVGSNIIFQFPPTLVILNRLKNFIEIIHS